MENYNEWRVGNYLKGDDCCSFQRTIVDRVRKTTDFLILSGTIRCGNFSSILAAVLSLKFIILCS